MEVIHGRCFEQVLSLMLNKRRDEAALAAQREDQALSNKMAAHEISGHSWMALIENPIAITGINTRERVFPRSSRSLACASERAYTSSASLS
jgi:hypothetical protein